MVSKQLEWVWVGGEGSCFHGRWALLLETTHVPRECGGESLPFHLLIENCVLIIRCRCLFNPFPTGGERGC